MAAQRTALDEARAGVRGAALAGITGALLCVQAARSLTVSPEEHPAVFERYMRRWARALIAVFGMQLHVSGDVPAPSGRGRLLIANHRSPMDVAILLELFGGHPVARADIERWPILGVATKRAGAIFVDREDLGSGASAIRAIRGKLEAGESVLVFPEAGTHEGDQVRPFKPGAFAALTGLDADILPVGLAYDPGIEFVEESFVDHVLRVAARPRTRCAVRIGPPQPPARNARRSAEAMQGVVQELVDQARADWRAWP